MDHDGFVWVVSSSRDGGAARIDPARWANAPTTCCEFLDASMATGDLTGAPRFDGLGPVVWTGQLGPSSRDCPVTWGAIDVQGTLPEGTRIDIEARVAATNEALAHAPWVTVVQSPPGTLPAQLGEALVVAGQESSALEVRVEIDPLDADELPILHAVTVERSEWCF